MTIAIDIADSERICKILGVDSSKCRSVSIGFVPGDAITARIELRVTNDQLAAITGFHSRRACRHIVNDSCGVQPVVLARAAMIHDLEDRP